MEVVGAASETLVGGSKRSTWARQAVLPAALITLLYCVAPHLAVTLTACRPQCPVWVRLPAVWYLCLGSSGNCGTLQGTVGRRVRAVASVYVSDEGYEESEESEEMGSSDGHHRTGFQWTDRGTDAVGWGLSSSE